MNIKIKQDHDNLISMPASEIDLQPEEGEKKSPVKKKSVHDGHRQRLRERAMNEGLEFFTDHEVLELLLGYSIPQRDTNPIAHRLIDEFGSLQGVMQARTEQLEKVDGVKRTTSTLIKIIAKTYGRYSESILHEKVKLTNRKLAQKYCLGISTGERNEQFKVICLDAQCRVLGTRKITDGSLNEVAAYPRMVAETALNYNAHSVILTHNHPGGTPTPSREDIASSLQLQRLLGGLGIILLDHIIVADMNTYSMVEHGDMDFRTRMKEDIEVWPDMSTEEELY